MRCAAVICITAILCHAGSLEAQDRYPVAVGLGGGYISSGQGYHGLALVSVAPPRWPIALRLDGLFAPRHPSVQGSDLASALSASAVITLRPWRVAPYLVVGATRTGAVAFEYPVGGPTYYEPARTELTGGLGLTMRFSRMTLFGEMRNLGRAGTPISFGLTF